MIKLSNGVEISEDTMVNALKKIGINVELSKPKHIFKAGDVVKNINGKWLLIIDIYSELYAVDKYGKLQGWLFTIKGQKCFEEYNYKFIGRQIDLLKE